MLIGEVARRAGITPSALRYYEREGLVPSPARVANRRIYDPLVLGRVSIIRLARDAGFSISETRAFVSKCSVDGLPSTRWQAMADRKVRELDALIARAARMKRLLKSSFQCDCSTIEDCERIMLSREDRVRSPHPTPKRSSKRVRAS